MSSLTLIFITALYALWAIQGSDNGRLEIGACLGVKNIGKPCAGKPHARFDEGGQLQDCSLLYPFTCAEVFVLASMSSLSLAPVMIAGRQCRIVHRAREAHDDRVGGVVLADQFC
jgi:hypothetical protein